MTGASLRSLLTSGRLVVAPGAPTPLLARIAAEAGFRAVYLSGAGLAHHELGLPDLGYLGLEDLVRATRRIVAVTNVPVIVDADTGFGSAPHVARTVAELEHAGAAAIQLEDQTAPKQCGHFPGTTVVSRTEMTERILAAVESRSDPDTVIIGRTDAVSSLGLAEALERAELMRQAGADMLFVEGLRDEASIAEVVQAFPGTPAVANLVEGGKSPLLTHEELDRLGVALAIHPGTATRAAALAARVVLSSLNTTGDARVTLKQVWEFADFNRMLGQEEINDRADGLRGRASTLVPEHTQQSTHIGDER